MHPDHPHSPAQLALAASISGVVGAYLTGEFDVDGVHTASCGLSMHGSVCTAAFVGTAVSTLVSLLIIAMQVGQTQYNLLAVNYPFMLPRSLHASQPAFQCPSSLPSRCCRTQCATAGGRAERLAFCGPILSSVGFFWWLAYGAAATSAQAGADHWQTELAPYRAGVCMFWGGIRRRCIPAWAYRLLCPLCLTSGAHTQTCPRMPASLLMPLPPRPPPPPACSRGGRELGAHVSLHCLVLPVRGLRFCCCSRAGCPRGEAGGASTQQQAPAPCRGAEGRLVGRL